MSCCNIFNCLPSPPNVLRKSGGKAKLSNSDNIMNEDLAYGTMDTDRPENVAGSNERVERPKNDRRKVSFIISQFLSVFYFIFKQSSYQPFHLFESFEMYDTNKSLDNLHIPHQNHALT